MSFFWQDVITIFVAHILFHNTPMCVVPSTLLSISWDCMTKRTEINLNQPIKILEIWRAHGWVKATTPTVHTLMHQVKNYVVLIGFYKSCCWTALNLQSTFDLTVLYLSPNSKKPTFCMQSADCLSTLRNWFYLGIYNLLFYTFADFAQLQNNAVYKVVKKRYLG